jgi:hypothetical protein
MDSKKRNLPQRREGAKLGTTGIDFTLRLCALAGKLLNPVRRPSSWQKLNLE